MCGRPLESGGGVVKVMPKTLLLSSFSSEMSCAPLR